MQGWLSFLLVEYHRAERDERWGALVFLRVIMAQGAVVVGQREAGVGV